MMSGTIVLAEGADWSASSGVFSWVIGFLADKVADETSRDTLRLIDEQNFGWLNMADLSEAGRRQVLTLLGNEIVGYSERELPAGPLHDDAVAKVGELAELARLTAH
jgi:hypothetical protein